MSIEVFAEARNVPTQRPVRRQASNERSSAPTADRGETRKDYFVERDGQVFAGTHLLVEMWQAHHLGDIARIDTMMRDAVQACGATLLELHLHHFGPGLGVSGVAVLAESHISIHTWPERGFAAIDIFMCGSCDPHDALPVLKRALEAGSVEVSEHRRGLEP